MKTIMPRSRLESFSLSRRYFNWKKKPEDDDDIYNDEDQMLSNFKYSSFHEESRTPSEDDHDHDHDHDHGQINGSKLRPTRSCEVVLPRISSPSSKTKKLSGVSKLASLFRSKSANDGSRLGLKRVIVGTLFGHRRGHVHVAFQDYPGREPAFLIELSTPTSVLVREMASGLVRVALECDKRVDRKTRLIEEPLWRAYCNGKKCGYAIKKDCGPEEWRVLSSIGPISMGAGVLPEESGGGGGGGGEGGPARIGAEGELMYMRAKFERIVGSRDSEAFYMMNPDRSGGPELSVYLLRV